MVSLKAGGLYTREDRMNRNEFWKQVFVEVLRQNGGKAEGAIEEADKALAAFDGHFGVVESK